jgi:hypothetical protein
LAYSFFFAFEVFDYHLFVMMCSLLALEVVKIEKRSYARLFCFTFIAAAIAAGVLTLRSLYGIYEGTYHAYVAGAVAIPFLMLFAALAGLFLAKDAKNTPALNYAVGCLAALQFFPIIAFVLLAVSSLCGSGVDVLCYISGASFLRISLGQFLWCSGWRFAGLAIQILAFAPFFALAFAQMAPDLFMRAFSRENRKRFLFSVECFAVVIAILTKAMSTIPNFLP